MKKRITTIVAAMVGLLCVVQIVRAGLEDRHECAVGLCWASAECEGITLSASVYCVPGVECCRVGCCCTWHHDDNPELSWAYAHIYAFCETACGSSGDPGNPNDPNNPLCPPGDAELN